ncbi:sodium/glucose cotransporter 4 isoform X2 [Tachyglossus aculeatus]|uniref:sodium/glucose cotransporter 4 isoform X2 n=1 Tax=Tachyglossus aculeatus TaxID=9261 RepID=UPI0018F29049|nr:sodium/glucose cotransporter 4 isoform X2 [Tachyglossus aculeatus]
MSWGPAGRVVEPLGAQEGPKATLGIYDIVVVVVYFIFVLGVGIWSSMRASRGTVGGYFLAGRSMTWWPIGASLMSSNVGSGLFIGLAGTGAAGGIAVGGFEWNATWLLLALGWIFVPVYIAAGVVTMPEYLRKRFGGHRIQIYMSVLSLALYIFTKISTDIFSGALFIQVSLGWDLYLSTAILLVVTAVYTVAGGLTAVIYTDALQTVIMVGGALVLTFLGFREVGGYPGLQDRYRMAVPNVTVPNTSCHVPRPDAFHMLRDPLHADIPWPGLIFGLSVLATWCWCTDQVIVQRSLSAKNLSHAKGGSVLGGYLKILPMFFIVMPGMISRALYPGLRGLLVAVIMAALMSSLTSIFNSSATLFAIDIWQHCRRRRASEQELMIVGRVFILVLVVVSILWIPIIQSANSGQLFDYIQSITSYLAPPITALFLLAIFSTRVTEPGAFWGLMSGLAAGLIRMVLEFSYPVPACGEEDGRPAVVRDVHYLYFALLLCGLTAIVIVAVSLCTPPIPEEKLARLTWWTRHGPVPAAEPESYGSSRPSTGDPNTGAEGDVREKPAPAAGSQRCCRALCSWLCGLPGPAGSQPDPAEKAELAKRLTSIEERPLWRAVCDIQAVILLAINVFLWGYFA